MKGKLGAARRRLEQLTLSHAAALSKPCHQHGPVNASMDLLQSEAPDRSMQPMQLLSLQASELGNSQHGRSEQDLSRTDSTTTAIPLSRCQVVPPTDVSCDDVGEDFDLCVICIEVVPQVKFQPCGHVVVCKPCASKVLLQTGECPMGRCQLSALELLLG